jgi:hypothetical protein
MADFLPEDWKFLDPQNVAVFTTKAVLSATHPILYVCHCERNILMEGLNKAQARIAEIDRGEVETIPGDIALAQVRQLLEQ